MWNRTWLKVNRISPAKIIVTYHPYQQNQMNTLLNLHLNRYNGLTIYCHCHFVLGLIWLGSLSFLCRRHLAITKLQRKLKILFLSIIWAKPLTKSKTVLKRLQVSTTTTRKKKQPIKENETDCEWVSEIMCLWLFSWKVYVDKIFHSCEWQDL